jgi:hypothetical protein
VRLLVRCLIGRRFNADPDIFANQDLSRVMNDAAGRNLISDMEHCGIADDSFSPDLSG